MSAIVRAAPARMKPSGATYIVFLGTLSALPPLSIDMGLPGIPAIEAGLPGAAGHGALTLSLFLAGFAVSPLCSGPLADRFGRRPILAVGLLVLALAAGFCVLATSFTLLLACRTAQGLAAGACVTMPLAIVRDVFDGRDARHHLSRITAVLGLAPLLAPVLGGWVMAVAGWRAIYATQAICALALLAVTLTLFDETLPNARRRPLALASLLSGYATVLRNTTFRGNTLAYALAFAAMFSFIASAPGVLMGQMALSPSTFSLAFALCSCGTLIGALVSGRLNARGIPGRMIVNVAAVGLVASAAALLLVTLAGMASVGTIVPLVAAAIFCFGLIGPGTNHDALQSLPDMAGLASGILRCVQMVLGAFASALVAWLQPIADPLPIMVGLMLAASIAAAVILWRLHAYGEAARDPGFIGDGE